jgi:hypothetical protein
MEDKKIRGKVAQILNEREVVINIGKDAGVKIGMKFKILAQTPLQITDPETGELLGLIDREKVRVVCSEELPLMSICRTYKTKLYPGLFGTSGSILNNMQDREVVENLKTEGSSFPPPLQEEDSFVKIGDRVESIVEDD